MALTITQQENNIILQGSLNATTLVSFKNHFNHILNTNKEVTLDLNHVTEMDASVMLVLKEMYKNAILSNNIFFIIGSNYKEIYENFNYPNVA